MQELVQRLKEKADLDSEPTLKPTIHQQMIEQLSADFERFFQNRDFQIELPKDLVVSLGGQFCWKRKQIDELTPGNETRILEAINYSLKNGCAFST